MSKTSSVQVSTPRLQNSHQGSTSEDLTISERKTPGDNIPYPQWDPRFQRVQRLWRRLAEFRDERIPRWMTGINFWRGYDRLVVDLARVLKSDGWLHRVRSVVIDSAEKKDALAILCGAMDADDGSCITSSLSDIVDSDWTYALGVHRCLREDLMYDVLGMERPPEKPSGWEGEYDWSVESREDFVRWLDETISFQALIARRRGQEPCCGSSVRNAFRLVRKLELRNMPLQPVGSFTYYDELAVLQNLHAACQQSLRLVGKSIKGNGSLLPPRPVITEEAINLYLQQSPEATVAEVMCATGLSKGTLERKSVWRLHENRRLEGYLKQHPEARAADAGLAFEMSASKVVTMPAWQEHRNRQEPRAAGRRNWERPLSEKTLACREIEPSPSAAQRMIVREELLDKLIEEAEPATRTRLKRLCEADRVTLVEYLAGVSDDGTLGTRPSGETVEILLEAARSWLEEHEESSTGTAESL